MLWKGRSDIVMIMKTTLFTRYLITEASNITLRTKDLWCPGKWRKKAKKKIVEKCENHLMGSFLRGLANVPPYIAGIRSLSRTGISFFCPGKNVSEIS